AHQNRRRSARPVGLERGGREARNFSSVSLWRWKAVLRRVVNVEAIMSNKMRVVLLATIAAVVVAASAFAQTGADSPEAIIRSLVKAMFSNDVATYEKITVPDPRRGRLVQGGRVNEEAKKELEEYPEAVQVKLTSPFRFKGQEIKPDAKGQYPVGTT